MHDDEPTHDELAWLAFRYVAGELDAAEQSQFELLLADDQAAREAVASAVELSQAAAVALVERPIVRDGRIGNQSSGGARWVWFVAGVAACVAVAVGMVQLSVEPSPTASGEADALAARWSEVREQAPPFPWADDVDESSAASSDWAVSLDELESQDEEAIAAPDWMLAAVLQQNSSDDMQEELPSEMERGSDESQDQ
jgi:hypothetical protein